MKNLYLMIVGSRDFNNYCEFEKVLLRKFPNLLSKKFDLEIISGGARGVDLLAKKFAQKII